MFKTLDHPDLAVKWRAAARLSPYDHCSTQQIQALEDTLVLRGPDLGDKAACKLQMARALLQTYRTISPLRTAVFGAGREFFAPAVLSGTFDARHTLPNMGLVGIAGTTAIETPCALVGGILGLAAGLVQRDVFAAARVGSCAGLYLGAHLSYALQYITMSYFDCVVSLAVWPFLQLVRLQTPDAKPLRNGLQSPTPTHDPANGEDVLRLAAPLPDANILQVSRAELWAYAEDQEHVDALERMLCSTTIDGNVNTIDLRTMPKAAIMRLDTAWRAAERVFGDRPSVLRAVASLSALKQKHVLDRLLAGGRDIPAPEVIAIMRG